MSKPWPTAEELAIVRAALDAMPKDRRSVYLLSARDGLDHTEIAAALGLSVPEVERCLAEALVDLMRALDRRDTSPPTIQWGKGPVLRR